MATTTSTIADLQQHTSNSITGKSKQSTLASLLPLPRSYFLSLTLPALTPGTHPQIRSAITGSHLIELRVDLLSPALHSDPSRFQPFVREQLHVLRSLSPLPVLFTVRTRAQGGSWPDDDVDGLLALYQLAIELEVEVLDVEIQLPDDRIEDVVGWARDRGASTELLMSHHDWTGEILWDNSEEHTEESVISKGTTAEKYWQSWYARGARFGDAIKLVGTARSSRDNIALENFRMRINAAARPDGQGMSLRGQNSELRAEGKVPLCAVNMGVKGQMSRVLNDFLTPVTHEALGRVAAPGQLSVREIEVAAKLLGLDGEEGG